MNNDTQIVKGILEGCILKILQQEVMYGYKIVEHLNLLGFEVIEATVYPILTRLQNKGILMIERRESPLGPARKYYSLTTEGVAALKEFQDTWQRIRTLVDTVIGENQHD